MMTLIKKGNDEDNDDDGNGDGNSNDYIAAIANEALFWNEGREV